MSNNAIPAEILIYQSESGEVRVEAKLEDETLWMTQVQLAELFQTTQQNISLHIRNVYDEGELKQEATHKKSLWVRAEGARQVQRELDSYNLDMILSVGYRVKSLIATRFRVWATQQLKNYIIKGFVIDDVRLKNPPIDKSNTPDYFNEMLAIVRDIRASERRVYLRVREILAMAADYAPSTAQTNQFFSTIQNKLHFAVTGLTAAEIIHQRVNHSHPNAGLITWAKSEVRKTDVTVAKNYLQPDEITELNRIVTMWLDFAEDRATRRKQVFMQEWAQQLDDFLRFNEREVLPNAGRVSKKQADEKAHDEYEQFAQERRILKENAGEIENIKLLESIASSKSNRKKPQP